MIKINKQNVKKSSNKQSCCRDNKLIDLVNYLADHGKENLAKRIVKSILK